ncbi:MAG: PASTA domain-containing protein [Spirochaetaceae bacterium]|jgi:beta-lactam-binding protein with PASTA domain|nr:PASTA domain-containing protein [Spirochaetaceae bacterium]
MAFNFDLSSLEDFMENHLRLFVSFTLGLLIFVGLIALSVFFIFIRGKEEVMVPDVLGKELPQALIELQEKELYPRIQLRTAAAGEEKGIVLEQSPEAGTLVKAERRIDIVISQGIALDKMDNFLGRNINDVRSAVRNFNTQTTEVAIVIREPFMYQYSSQTAGTVLQQKPAPETEINGNVVLELVVSRGQENTRITVPDLVGLSFTDALTKLSQLKTGFVFTMRNPWEGEKAGFVYTQNPAGAAVLSADGKITVGITTPAAAAGEGAGLFSFALPANPYPLPLTVEAELPNGTRQILVSTNHSGGDFSIPYKLPANSVIVLSMVDREIYRQIVTDGS